MKAYLKAVPVVKSTRDSKDGKSTYYNVGLAQDGELIEFSTNEVVFSNLKLYEPVNLELTLTKGEYQGKVFERKFISNIMK